MIPQEFEAFCFKLDLKIEKVLLQAGPIKKWCRGAESNCRHVDFQSTALPTELPRHFFWWKRQGSNLWPLACKASALPLSYASTPGALKGIRTPAAGLKGQCPRPLDDEGAKHR